MENGKVSCSECSVHATASDCEKFNNIFSRLFSFIFRTNQQASIDMIKEKGYEEYAKEMAEKKTQAIKK